jgi:arsenite methyltransferase
MLQFDDETAGRIEATYLTPDVVEQRRVVRAALGLRPGRRARVLDAWTEHLADPYLPRRLPRYLREAGFALERCEVVPILNRRGDGGNFSSGVIALIAGFVAGRRGVSAADAEAWAADLVGRTDDYFFSLNRYLFVATR